MLELEQSATERDVATIVEGHEDLLAMRDQMSIDDSNTPCLVGYETIHFDSGANCILFKTDTMLAASTPLDSSKGALGTASQSGKLTHEGTAKVTMYVKGGANEHSPVELEGRVESELKVKVVIGPSGEHESVHKAEAHMDPCNRATEAMISRARRNLQRTANRWCRGRVPDPPADL